MSILQDQLNNCIRDIDQVLPVLGITGEEADTLRQIAQRYPISIPPYYLNLIDPSDPEDPVRKLCIPSEAEYSAEGHEDQSGEAGNTVLTGVQQNSDLRIGPQNGLYYHGRLLPELAEFGL